MTLGGLEEINKSAILTSDDFGGSVRGSDVDCWYAYIVGYWCSSENPFLLQPALLYNFPLFSGPAITLVDTYGGKIIQRYLTFLN